MTEPYVHHPAFAVTARSGLTGRKAVSWTALPQGPRLLVPVDVQALVVRPGEKEPHAQLSLDLLERLATDPGAPGPHTVEPFTDQPNERGPGAYLHWAMPDGLTQATTGSDGKPRWRPLPNRWLVARLGNTKSRPRHVRAWVIEADRCGRAELDAWRDGNAGPYRTPKLLPRMLTAVTGADPAWAAIYDNVENRFGFHDDWSDLAGQPDDVLRNLAYVVVGWYSDAQLDPLAEPEGVEGFHRLLRELGWSINAERLATAQTEAERIAEAVALVGLDLNALTGEPTVALGELTEEAAGLASTSRSWWPRQSVYHGVIYGVQGSGLSPPDPRPEPGTPQVSVGTTSTEGLAAQIASRLGDPDAEFIQATFNCGLADAFGAPDGLPRVEEELHTRAFTARPGGERTEMVAVGDPFTAVRPTTPRTPASSATLAAVTDRSVRFEFTGTGAKVTDLHMLTTQPERVATPPDPRRVEQNTRPLPRWLTPQDPVIVVGGLHRSLRHGYDGRFSPDETLACRLSGDTVTRLAGVIEGRTLLDRTIEHGAVPDDAGALLIEAAIEDPFANYGGNVEELAGRYQLDFGALLRLLAAEGALLFWSQLFPSRAASLQALSLKDGIGGSPAGITLWRQAWLPLYLEWELDFALRKDLTEWSLDELDYAPPAGPGLANRPTGIQTGRSLLVAANAKALADQISAFLSIEDKLDLRGEGRVDADLQARLRALSESAGFVDVLSAGIDGFRERLLGFPEDLALAPTGGTLPPRLPTAPPQLLRAGFARLGRLRVVDTFGRSLTLIEGARPTPTVSAGLRTSRPGEWVLRPRLNPPARILLRMVDASDDTIEAGVDQAGAAASPLAGWLLADHADDAAEFFAPDGTPLGQLTHDALTGAVIWEGPPGTRASIGTTPADALGAEPRLRHLKALTTGLLERDALEQSGGVARSDTPLQALLRVLDTTRATVGLGGHTGTEHLAELLGRPVAVVRATLRFEVEPEQPFPTLPKEDQDARAAAWAGLTGRAFPFRLGALTRLDDGLLGFWLDDDYSALHPVDPSVLEQAPPSGRHQGDLAAGGTGGLESRPINSPSVAGDGIVLLRPGQTVRLTLLMDPASKVHVTSGLLPRKSISLLRDWFAEALERVVPSFRIGPVLVDPSTIRMPAPAALGRDQTWTRREAPTRWRDDTITAANQQALLPETAVVVQEGYLRVVPGKKEGA